MKTWHGQSNWSWNNHWHHVSCRFMLYIWEIAAKPMLAFHSAALNSSCLGVYVCKASCWSNGWTSNLQGISQAFNFWHSHSPFHVPGVSMTPWKIWSLKHSPISQWASWFISRTRGEQEVWGNYVVSLTRSPLHEAGSCKPVLGVVAKGLLQMDVSGFEDAFELSIRLHDITFDCTPA